MNFHIIGASVSCWCEAGRPVAELSPVPAGMRLGDLPSLLASLPKLAPGDAEVLARDLDAARCELDLNPLRDPWDS